MKSKKFEIIEISEFKKINGGSKLEGIYTAVVNFFSSDKKKK